VPLKRCLDCRQLSTESRCSIHRAAIKARRNADADIHRRVVAQASVCAICGEPPRGRMPEHPSGDPLTADHIIPVSRGGSSTWDNLQAAHRSCNSRKRDRL
jgi:5-methylcytosine-specific restriction endonuclease McrA